MIFTENNLVDGLLADGKIVIITGKANKNAAIAFSKFLSKEEQERADRYRNEIDQYASIVSHGVKRKMLSIILKKGIDDLKFTKDKYGKPLCSDSNTLSFNISHSNGFVAIAFKMNGNIGIDIEFPRDINYKEISKSVLNLKELRQYELQGFKDNFFVEHWTKKEAATKASGHGLYKNFPDIHFEKSLIDNLETTYIDEKEYTIFHTPFENGHLALASGQHLNSSDVRFLYY